MNRSDYLTAVELSRFTYSPITKVRKMLASPGSADYVRTVPGPGKTGTMRVVPIELWPDSAAMRAWRNANPPGKPGRPPGSRSPGAAAKPAKQPSEARRALAASRALADLMVTAGLVTPEQVTQAYSARLADLQNGA